MCIRKADSLYDRNKHNIINDYTPIKINFKVWHKRESYLWGVVSFSFKNVENTFGDKWCPEHWRCRDKIHYWQRHGYLMKDLTVSAWVSREAVSGEGCDECLDRKGCIEPNNKWSYLLCFLFIFYFRDCWGGDGLWKIKFRQDVIRFAFIICFHKKNGTKEKSE